MFFLQSFFVENFILTHSTAWIAKLVQREQLQQFHRMSDFEWWQSVVAESVRKDGNENVKTQMIDWESSTGRNKCCFGQEQ